jgi:CheY-like chemotaxis protein
MSEAEHLPPRGVAPGCSGPPRAGSGLRVLVVDDCPDSALSLALLLELWGHEVHPAYDGAAAFRMACELRPDVVLLDLGLPGMSGWELAARLRRQVGLERALLVATTGYGREEDRRLSRAAGCDVHLLKPVDLNVLADLLTARRAEIATR